MVADNDMTINILNIIKVVKHPVENRSVAYLEQRLWEILRKRVEASGVPCCYNYIFHVT